MVWGWRCRGIRTKNEQGARLYWFNSSGGVSGLGLPLKERGYKD